jgi:CRP-like cAMP-binding protein
VTELLDLLDEDDRRALEAVGTVERAPRGRVLLHHGQVPDKVVILYAGRAKVVAPPTQTGSEAVLSFRGPGALLGDQALLDGSPRGATVVAVEPVEYLVVAGSALRACIERRPAIAIAMLAVVSRRLRESDGRLAQFASADTMGRVAARLVELCEHHGERADDGTVTITLPLTQEDLAGWTGASLEATAKALRALRRLGWITTARRAIVVHDLEELRRRAA